MKRVFPLLAVLAFAGCGDDPTDPGVSTFIGQITGGGATATVVSGTPPAANGAFPGVIITAPTTVTPGTSVQVELHASGTSFTRVYVQIAGMARYFQLALPAAVTHITVTITLTPQISVPNFEFVFGLSGSFGQNYGSRVVGVS